VIKPTENKSSCRVFLGCDAV